MKKCLFLFLFYFCIASCRAGDVGGGVILKKQKDIGEIEAINMSNCETKMNYIINKLVIDKEYNYKENKLFFQYIIIGLWHEAPHTVYQIQKNNSFSMATGYSNEIVRDKGSWRIDADYFELSSSIKKTKKKILYCALHYSKENNRYNFEIGFDDPSFTYNLDTDIAKMWMQKSPL